MAYYMHQKSHIQIQFEQLNLLYQFPRLYLHQFFSELKTRIDISFAKKDLLLACGPIKVNKLCLFLGLRIYLTLEVNKKMIN
jgi:hypothetical protein